MSTSSRTSKSAILLLVLTLFTTLLSGVASAHSNNGKSQEAHHKNENKSNKNEITSATAIKMIVDGLKLNIDNIRFIKQPLASDYYTRIKNDASYAQAFIIAFHNGLEIDKDISPSAKVSREQFAKWLYQGLSRTGDYASIEIFYDFKDADKVTKGYMDSIQKLLIAKIAVLDKNQKFFPKQKITKAQATTMIDKTKKFIKDAKSQTPENPQPTNPEIGILSNVTLSTEKWSDDLTRVTVRATVPHRGYGIDIAKIEFVKDVAIISYRVVQPDPAAFYAQVISDVETYAYIPSRYKATLGTQLLSEPRA
ncbi:MAG: S-layer homology domain-containing protein [Candidatus Cohnella colombiensis]|uniref:S-layer homology domain-containing protein n=1 Tax=Candidatus Cohnella colombiensis TaxID=3121368 RepID=A0AA95ET62_9BACL|nr:MAG: S-layer homology domain-containing protein [Cohnella sp.]